MQYELSTLRKQVAQFQRENAVRQVETLVSQGQELSGVTIIATSVDVPDDKVLREMGEMMRSKLKQPHVVVLAAPLEERIALQVNVEPSLTKRGLHAGKIAAAVGQKLGGKGGGRPDVAQGGGKNKAELGAALELVTQFVRENLQ
jgi:alanyl-tRNA synthetase